METVSKKYRCASIDIGVKNLALCVNEFLERGDGTFAFNLVHIERVAIGRSSDTMHVLAKRLLAFYDTNDALTKQRLDFVFIEQQLSRAVKNIVLAYTTMAYFETRNKIGRDSDSDRDATKVVFVSPAKKFKAIKFTFPSDLVKSIDFDRRGRNLKKLSVDVATLLFTSFDVEVGLRALSQYRTKLDDVSDVFLQSFAFFLEKFSSKPVVHVRGDGAFSFIGAEKHGQCEDADEKA